MADAEVPLAGGNVNAGVVRVGETVRRATTNNSPAVHRLLQHLETKGFEQAPRFLGLDEKGREVLSFIPGGTAVPNTLWTRDAALVAAVSMLRAYHDTQSGFGHGRPEDWAFAWPDPAQHEVICHNDFAPYNMVFRNGLPAAIIDFDLAGPGPRLRDLAYLAYWLVPLSFASQDVESHRHAQSTTGWPRLKLLMETYGTAQPNALLAMVGNVLNHMADPEAAARMVGAEAAHRLRAGGHFDHWRQEAEAFESNVPNITAEF